MITKEEKNKFKKLKLYKIWNFLIYGSSVAIGVFLVYLYSAYVFINKWRTFTAQRLHMGFWVFLLLGLFAYPTFKIKH